MTDKVQIDKYVILTEKSPKIIIFDNELQRHICSFNTLDADVNMALANILLDELNTGAYEPVDEESDPVDIGGEMDEQE